MNSPNKRITTTENIRKLTIINKSSIKSYWNVGIYKKSD